MSLPFSTISKQDYGTPWDLFWAAEREFGPFNLDAAASKSNAKVPNYLSIEEGTNALDVDWRNYIGPLEELNAWLNPEYQTKIITPFMAKCVEMREKGGAVTALVNVAPETKWWKTYIHAEADVVLFLDRRVKFVGAPSSNPRPSCIVHWNKNTAPKFKRPNLRTFYDYLEW